MGRNWKALTCAGVVVLITFSLLMKTAGAQADPQALLKEADRLAWLRAWSAAERRFSEAGRLFTAQGDKRNALYSEISVLRGQLPRLPVPEVSERLAEYLENPLVQAMTGSAFAAS